MTVHKCQITIFNSSATVLSKGYTLVKGMLTPRPNPGALVDGSYQVYDIPDLMRLSAVLTAMTTNHGLVACSPTFNIDGGPAAMEGRAMSRALAASQVGEHRAGIITRTGDSFPARQPGLYVLVVDFDRCPAGILCLGQLRDDLAARLPELDCAIHLRTSASCLLGVRGGGYLKGFKAHGFIIVNVQNDSEFKAIGRAIRLRLEPHDYVIDTSVQTPEHWIFAGPGDYGTGLKPMVSEPMIVPGAPTLDARRLLASVPAEEVVLRPVMAGAGEARTVTESERRRYTAFLRYKLDRLRAWGEMGKDSGRHQELNDACMACGPYWLNGLISTEALWAIVEAGASTNGYAAEEGWETVSAEFEKGLEAGGRLIALPALAPVTTADQAFGGVAIAPCLPDMVGVGDASNEAHTWLAGWLARYRPDIDKVERGIWNEKLMSDLPLAAKHLAQLTVVERESLYLCIKTGAYVTALKRCTKELVTSESAKINDVSEEFATSTINERFAFVDDGCFWWDIKHNSQVKYNQIVEKFAPLRIANADGEGKIKYTPATQIWFNSEKRRWHSKVSYEPGTEPDDTIGSALNCWRGWGFKLEHLDKAVAESVVADFKTLTAALCNNDLEDAHKLTQAIAHSIQRPQIKIRRGLLFANPTEGVGKTMFVEFICALHGTDNCAMVDATAFGKFLDWARCKTVIACEELFNDPKEAAGIAAILKILVSNDLLDSAGKYEKRLSFPNMALVFVLSNKLDAIHFKDEDRRWDVRSPHTVLSKAFYARMATYKASPSALAAVAQYLSTYDLTGFDPNERAVMTEAKTAMVEAGRSDLETFIRGVMENEDGGKELWTAEDLQVAYNHLLTTIQREQVTIHRVRMLATSMSIPKRRPNLPVDASGKRGKGPTLYLMRNAEAWQNATEEAVLNAYKPPCKLGQTPEKDPGLPKNVH